MKRFHENLCKEQESSIYSASTMLWILLVDIHASEARIMDNGEVLEEFDKDEHYFGPY